MHKHIFIMKASPDVRIFVNFLIEVLGDTKTPFMMGEERGVICIRFSYRIFIRTGNSFHTLNKGE